MRRALELARKGEGRTSPNPLVGAVIVKHGRVVGEGYHKKAGGPHAEIAALRKAAARARGADLYVNLEPCCHHGRTPPCTQAIIDAGIKNVMVGMRDPNKRIGGKGIRQLKKNGVRVTAGVLRKECGRINEVFVKYIRTRRPYVILKSALSLDGRIATRSGDSQWISGPQARERVHQMRDKADAVLVGSGTVLKDNPRLTARLKKGKGNHPARVILDGRNRVPLTANVFKNGGSQRIIYVSGPRLRPSRGKRLRRMGVEVLVLNEKKGNLDLRQLMKKLGKMEFSSLLIEGGAEVYAGALKAGIVDKIVFFVAPIIIGGRDARGAVGGEGIEKIRQAYKIKNLTVVPVGNDLMLEGNL